MAYQMLITADKGKLIAKMRENRRLHREVFEDALEGYRATAVKALKKELQLLEEGRKPDKVSIYLDRPEDHTRDYDRVIGMLEMHQGESFTLDEGTYAKYMNDEWDWKDRWVRLSNSYSSRSASVYGDPDD